MPLAYPSRSHGTIAFGFFNIEIDMLLLDHLFFFADHFCQAVVELAAGESSLQGYRIEDRDLIGNLHGAIAGVDLSGFIGATYRRFPFPADPAGFKQNPEGMHNQPWARTLIADYASAEPIHLRRDPATQDVCIGEFSFHQEVFARLIAYVDRGGHPRWKDDVRPAYVQEMNRRLGDLGSAFAQDGARPLLSSEDDGGD